MRKSFREIFNRDKTTLIGMIHLAGDDFVDKMSRAFKEIDIYRDAGFDGIIIENYHGDIEDMTSLTKRLLNFKEPKIVIGSNFLGRFISNFIIADEFKLPFIQIDSIHPNDIILEKYNSYRKNYSDISVFGGINFKYQTQESGEELKRELQNAMGRCEAIVTTGEGTGIETPIKNLEEIRSLIGDFPLIAGAGVNKNNAYETSRIVDGIIIGSYVKDGNTLNKVNQKRCEEIRSEVDKN